MEVELQYQKDDWDDSQYDGFMGDVRKRLEQKYGEGQLVARAPSRSRDRRHAEDRGLEVEPEQHRHRAGLFRRDQSPSQVFRTLSVHYKTY